VVRWNIPSSSAWAACHEAHCGNCLKLKLRGQSSKRIWKREKNESSCNVLHRAAFAVHSSSVHADSRSVFLKSVCDT
jgi:hypothetical protein